MTTQTSKETIEAPTKTTKPIKCSMCQKQFTRTYITICETCQTRLEAIQNEQIKPVNTYKKTRQGKPNQLLLQSDNNSVYNIIYEIKLLLLLDKNNSTLAPQISHKLLSSSEKDLDQVGKILSIKGLRKMAWYFLDYGAATAAILQNRLGITEPTTYRYMKDLKTFNFISLGIKARKPRGKKGGPRPEIWIVPDATTTHINEAQRLHKNIVNPKYLYAEEMAQLMLDEYILPKKMTEISRKDYFEFLRGRNVKRSMIPDIIIISTPYLQEKGIKVWI